jgi:hypothetical protein
MSAVKMQVIDGSGNVLAETGFLDAWIAERGRPYSAIRGLDVKQKEIVGTHDNRTLSDQGSAVFSIRRVGDEYAISIDDNSLLLKGKGVNNPVTAVKLVFKSYKFSARGKYPESHFGTFILKKVGITPVTTASR